MLKKYLQFIFLIFLCNLQGILKAQLACGYTFSYSANTPYTPLNSGSETITLAAGFDSPDDPFDISPTDEDFFPHQPIGFPFLFNGQTYTHLGVSTNGWIWFGETSPVRAAGLVVPFTNILSSDFPLEGIVSALNADLEGRWTAADAGIRTHKSGSSPNRTFIIEWKNFKSLDDAEGTGFCGENRNRFDFQIILQENNNQIHFSYNTSPYCWQGYEQFFQIGLRGHDRSDTHTRNVGTGSQAWERSTLGMNHATATMRSSSPVTFPAENARFTFQPGAPVTITWLGINNNWFDPINWNPQVVPMRCNNVIVPAGLSYYPELSGNQPAESASLTISEGAALSILEGYNSFLSCYGSFLNNGVITNNTSTFITLAGGSNQSLGGDGYFISTDLFITGNSSYSLTNDLVVRNLQINEGSALKLMDQILDVYSIWQIGTLDQGNGLLVIEGDPASVELTDSTFIENQGTTFFGNGEVWANPTNQLVPSIQYNNLWVRTNKDFSVQLGSDNDFSCRNLMFYNPGEPGGVAETARNIQVTGAFRLGIDSLPGTELILNHKIQRNQSGGQFEMGDQDALMVKFANSAAISGFTDPNFKGNVTYSSNLQQAVMKGSYQNLKIAGSGLRLVNGKINLRGILELENGTLQTNDSLLLKSDSLHTALISGSGQGVIQGSVEIEHFVHGNGTQYILYSSPFEQLEWNAIDDHFELSNVSGSNSSLGQGIWEFTEQEANPGFAAGWQSRNTQENQLINMKAYLASVDGNQVIKARGTVKTGLQKTGVSSNASEAAGKGWNLVGNPYPSPIDWNAVIATQSPLISKTLVKAGTGNRYNGHYASWLPLGSSEGIGINGASRYVGSMEGFFVQAFSNDTLVLYNSHRAKVLNTRSVQVPEQIPFLRLSLTSNETADETVVYFSQQCSNSVAVDGQDAMKIPSLPGKSFWCSVKDSIKLAIQGRNRLQQEDSVALEVVVAQSGYFQMRLSEITHFPATAMVFLEDRLNNTYQNMRQQPSYQVFLNEGTISNRFYLHVIQGIQVNAFDEGCSGHEGRIALNNATGMNWDVRVYNPSDSLVGEQNNFTGTWEITSLTADEYRIHFMMSGQSLEVDEYVTIENGNGIVAQLTASATEIKMEEEELLLNCINQDAENIFWDLGDGTMVSGESEIAHIYQNSGNYQVMLTVRKGTCSDTATAEIMVINITGIEDAIASEQTIVKLYPNPASSIAFIQAKIEEPVKAAEVLVIDMAGRIVYQSEPKTLYPGNLLEIPVIGLPNGTYETILLLDGKRKGLRLSVNHK
jgi:hypothetical protein